MSIGYTVFPRCRGKAQVRDHENKSHQRPSWAARFCAVLWSDELGGFVSIFLYSQLALRLTAIQRL